MTEKLVLEQGRCRSQWKQWLGTLTVILPIVMIGFVEMYMYYEDPMSSRYAGVPGELQEGIILFGCVTGAILGAVSADIFGRKRTLLATTICVAGGIINVILPSSTSSILISLIGGISAGIAFTVVPVYISEIADDHIRGRLLMLQLSGIYIGKFILITIRYINEPMAVNVILFAIPILFSIAIYWFPESPYYLASKNQYKAAAESLAFFRGTADEEVQVVINHVEENNNHKDSCQRIFESFRGQNRTGLIIIVLLIIIQGNEMSLYRGDNVGFSLSSILPMKSADADIVMSATLLIWTGVLVFTIDIVGRRRYLLGSTFVGLALAILATMVEHTTLLRSNQSETFIVVNLILHLCQIVIFGVPLVLIGELFPTNVRSIASSVTVIFGAILKSIFLLSEWLQLRGVDYDYWVHILIYLFAFLFIFAFVPETKKNTFAEIQNALAEIGWKYKCNTILQYNQLDDEHLNNRKWTFGTIFNRCSNRARSTHTST